MQEEMSRLRGAGLSLQEIATELSKKYDTKISHQTVSYQLQKRKENELNHQKSLRIIEFEKIEFGSNRITLSNHEFEKNRISDFVYQKNRDVHEIRSDCVHSTNMILPNNIEDESYASWREVYSRNIDPRMLDLYISVKKNEQMVNDAEREGLESYWNKNVSRFAQKQDLLEK